MKKILIIAIILNSFCATAQVMNFDKVVLYIRNHNYGFEYDSISHTPFYIRNNAIQKIEFLEPYTYSVVDVLFKNKKNEIPTRFNHRLDYFFVIDFYKQNRIIYSIYMEYNGAYELYDIEKRAMYSFKKDSDINKILNTWIFPNTGQLGD